MSPAERELGGPPALGFPGIDGGESLDCFPATTVTITMTTVAPSTVNEDSLGWPVHNQFML